MKPFTLVQTVILFYSFLLLRCSDLAPIAGATDMPNETASVSAVIHDSAGTPVRRAAVIMARAEYLAPLPQTAGSGNRGIFLTMTDESGRFVVDSLDSGSYMIEVNNGSGAACRIHCTIGNDTGIKKLGTFAVQPYAAIVGKIDTVGMPAAQRYIQIYGLNRIVPVESNGFFSIGGLPADLFTIRIVSIDTAVKPIDISDIRLSPGETKNLYAPWAQSMKINVNTTLSGAGVSGTVYGFPVLVRLNSTSFNFSSAQIDGRDIRFTKPDNTMLPYEIERWDAAAGLAEVWVKLDTVYGNDSSHYFVMYWGNPNAAESSNGTSVFDTADGFIGVWHLAESGNDPARDATRHHYDGTPTDTAPQATGGVIGGALQFDGNVNGLVMKNTAAGPLNFPRPGAYTFSAWVSVDTVYDEDEFIAGKGFDRYALRIKGTQSIPANMFALHEYVDAPVYRTEIRHAPVVMQQWKYMAGVRDTSGSYLFIDGRCVDSSGTIVYGGGNPVDTTNFSIGRCARSFVSTSNPDDYLPFRGKVDEVRIARGRFSADWIKLSYMNQKPVDMLIHLAK
jgi:hypothetical protein